MGGQFGLLIETILDDGVLTIILNDPGRRNAMGDGMRGELLAALEQASADLSVRAVVLRGAGGTFCSGGDLAAMPPANLAAARNRLAHVASVVRTIRNSPTPTFAVVEGAAAGLGASLALACDYLYMADDARLLFPFSRLGLLPDGGILHSLAARIGVHRARQLLLEGRSVNAEECLDLGLADYRYPPDRVMKEAADNARALSSAAPRSVAGIKSALAGGLPSLEDAFRAEHAGQPACYFSDDFAEGKRAFSRRELPHFSGS